MSRYLKKYRKTVVSDNSVVGGPSWNTVHKWAVEKLDKLRESNDWKDYNERETAFIRGEIAILKGLLELPGNPGKVEKIRSGLLSSDDTFAGY